MRKKELVLVRKRELVRKPELVRKQELVRKKELELALERSKGQVG